MYSVDIDFDEASRAWRANKKKLPNGEFAYICGAQRSGGKVCTKEKSKCKNNQHAKQFMKEDNLDL